MRKKFFLALLVVCLMMAGTVECEESNLLNHTVVPVWLVGMPLNGTTIPADCQDTLVKLAKAAAARPDITIVIKGLCSVEGSENYNLALALRRARKIEFFLVSKGVAPGRIRAIGIGRLSATDGADVRGVLLEIIYIPKNVRVDITAIEAARLSAIAAAKRAEAAEMEAKAWAAEAKSQADRSKTEADRSGGFAVSANLALGRTEVLSEEAMADAQKAKAEADRAKEERERAEAIAESLAKERKDASPPPPQAPPPAGPWKLEVGGNFSSDGYGYVDIMPPHPFIERVNTIAGDGWYGFGVTLTPAANKNWQLSVFGMQEAKKFQGGTVRSFGIETGYHIEIYDKLSLCLGVKYEKMLPFDVQYPEWGSKKLKTEETKLAAIAETYISNGSWFIGINWIEFISSVLKVEDLEDEGNTNPDRGVWVGYRFDL
ncbi:OmpA family protein [Patescibacteria group bacterium]|nr:OmpA family protein [Patescibacteria group bacterium]